MQNIDPDKSYLSVYSLIDLVLYGNFWIAFCAVAMTAQTMLLTGQALTWTPLLGFVGFSTLMLYALHRIVGLKKVQAFTDRGRYFVIQKFKKHILIYALTGAVGALVCFFLLQRETQVLLIIPGVLSLGYVIPFLSGQRRLRDLNHIKIYPVALVWAWITVVLPLLESDLNHPDILQNTLLFLERTCFIFAITLPFDIRDLQIDGHTGVQTIPSQIGVQNSKYLSLILLSFAFNLALLNLNFGLYSPAQFLGFSFSLVLTAVLVFLSDKRKEDYFFTGAMDGSMIFQFLMIYLFT